MMRINNYRTSVDETTHEEFATVDVSIDFETLYMLTNVLNKECKEDILMALGQEIVEQIQEHFGVEE